MKEACKPVASLFATVRKSLELSWAVKKQKYKEGKKGIKVIFRKQRKINKSVWGHSAVH